MESMSVQLITRENSPGDTEAADLLLPPSSKNGVTLEQLCDLAVFPRALLESVLAEVVGWTLLIFAVVVDISEMTVFIFG